MTVRKSKPEDQEQAHRVFILITELIKKHPEIEPRIWISGWLGLITQSFVDSDVSYEDYFSDMVEAIKSYKSWWKKD